MGADDGMQHDLYMSHSAHRKVEEALRLATGGLHLLAALHGLQRAGPREGLELDREVQLRAAHAALCATWAVPPAALRTARKVLETHEDGTFSAAFGFRAP